MASAAERKRRSRKHQAGDHSLCKAPWCTYAAAEQLAELDEQAAQPVDEPAAPPEPSVPAPPGLAARGTRLWREMAAGGALTPAQRTLIEEACRIADRLEQLATALRHPRRVFGIEISAFGDIELVVNGPLAEARAQVTALKYVFAELRQHGGTGQAAATSGDANVADLTARIAAQRRAATAG